MGTIENKTVQRWEDLVTELRHIAEQKATAAIQKFGGLEELDYPYVKTPFFSLLRKRAGWLIILFIGEI